mgnify:CR=1 FL=1
MAMMLKKRNFAKLWPKIKILGKNNNSVKNQFCKKKTYFWPRIESLRQILDSRDHLGGQFKFFVLNPCIDEFYVS